MNHDFESQAWADHHHQFRDAIRHLFSTATRTIDRLHAHVFDAPWKDEGIKRC